MKELWIKQTVFKRLLIQDDEIEEVKDILSQNTKESFNFVVDAFDKNNKEIRNNYEYYEPFCFGCCKFVNGSQTASERSSVQI